MKLERLYNWLFHYNPHTEKWTAFHRDDHSAYWNKTEKTHPTFVAKEFSELIKILHTSNLCI